QVGRLYREFRRRFRPTPEMHDFYYNSRYFRHFYRDAAPRFPRALARPDRAGECDAVTERLLRLNAAELRQARARLCELETVRQQIRRVPLPRGLFRRFQSP